MKTFLLVKLLMLMLLALADSLIYVVKEVNTTVVSCAQDASGLVAIPTIYEGRLIIRIRYRAFSGCSTLTGIKLGKCHPQLSVFMPSIRISKDI